MPSKLTSTMPYSLPLRNYQSPLTVLSYPSALLSLTLQSRYLEAILTPCKIIERPIFIAGSQL